MVAISIISKCNNNCKYCFQKDSYHEKNLILSYEDFEDIAEWSKGVAEIKLMGGEPTLHPEILKMAKKASENSPLVAIFSNLLGSTKTYEDLINSNTIKGWLINTTTRKELKSLFEENMNLFKKYGAKITAGITLMHDDEYDHQSIENLVRLGKKYPDVIINYRIGIATPFHKNKVELLNYNDIVLELAKIIKKETPNIPYHFDCPVNNCQISLKTMGILMEDYNVQRLRFSTSCNPVVEILADKSVKYCSSVPDDFLEFKSYNMFKNWRDCAKYLSNYKNTFLRQFEKVCRYEKKCFNFVCTGPCLANLAYIIKQDLEKNS